MRELDVELRERRVEDAARAARRGAFPAVGEQAGDGPRSLGGAWTALPAAAVQVRTLRLVGARLRPANDVAFHVLIGGAD
jgi:hypothetical protein